MIKATRFSNGYINRKQTVLNVAVEISEKGSCFNIAEVTFGIRSMGIKENQISDKQVRRIVNEESNFSDSIFQKAPGKPGWIIRS